MKENGPKERKHKDLAKVSPKEPGKITIENLKAGMTGAQKRIFFNHVDSISQMKEQRVVEECLAMHILGFDKNEIRERVLYLAGAPDKEASVEDK